jgi:hypothetical protein
MCPTPPPEWKFLVKPGWEAAKRRATQGDRLSYPAMSTDRPDDAQDGRRRHALLLVFFLLTATALLVRFAIPPQVMDRILGNSSDGGPFYAKLHLGTYAILLLTPFALLGRPILLQGDEIPKFRSLSRFCLLLVALIVFELIVGHAPGAGQLVDTYLVAGAAALLVLSFGATLRRRLGDLVLVLSLISAVLGLFEAFTHIRLTPYPYQEPIFRPLGLTNHPLTFGVMCASSIPFIALTGWKRWLKLLAATLLFVATAAAGARFALILATAEIPLLVIFVPWEGLSRRAARAGKLAALLFCLCGGAELFALLAAAGFLARFSNGVLDQNYLARVNVYDIFHYVTWQQVVFGMDAHAILKLVNEKLALPFIESAPVDFIFALGAPFAAVLAILIAWIFLHLLQHARAAAWIGILVFFGTALSNNLLSGKTPVVAIFMVLLVAYAEASPGATPGRDLKSFGLH